MKCEAPNCKREGEQLVLLQGSLAHMCEEHIQQYHKLRTADGTIVVEISEKPKKKRKRADPAEGNQILYWAQSYVQAVPTYYDRNAMWWVWNFTKGLYERTDETDILNNLRYLNEGIKEQTFRMKTLIVEALRQCARENEPEELGKEWIQFGNRLYNITTGDDIEASPDYFITNPIPWTPGESEETPILDDLFSQWVGEEYKDALYEIIAFTTISDYPLHRFFVLTGQGLNGKGTYMTILERFIGEHNTTNVDLDALTDGQNRFEKANLYKKLLCTVGETNYGLIKKTGILKSVTGGDLLTFEFKNKNPFQARNYAKIIMATNSLPPTTDRTTGFYRRTFIIDFPNRFEENPKLLDSIPEEEYHNLAKKCLRVVKELLERRKFTGEGSIEERAQRYEDVSNPLQRFLREQTTTEPNSHIWKYEFRDRFLAWQEKNGYRQWSEKQIGVSMKELYEDQRLNVEDKKWSAWVGLSWKTIDASGQGGQDGQGILLSSLRAKSEVEIGVHPVHPVSASEKPEFRGGSERSDSLDRVVPTAIKDKIRENGGFATYEELQNWFVADELVAVLHDMTRSGDLFESKPGKYGVLE